VGEIEAVIAAEKAEMNKRISRHLIQVLVMLLGIAALILFLARIFSGRIKHNLDRFTTSFSDASKGHGKIDVAGLGFAEFESLALSANSMIDARNRAYDEQQETREWLETILNSIQSGIVVVDANKHRIVDANPEVVRLIGAPREEIVGAVCHK
jgi:PAS domain-containing protein